MNNEILIAGAGALLLFLIFLLDWRSKTAKMNKDGLDKQENKRQRIEKEIEKYQFIVNFNWVPNGVAPNNPNRDDYLKQANRFFGLGNLHPDIQDIYDIVVAYENRKTDRGKLQLERDLEKHETRIRSIMDDRNGL